MQMELSFYSIEASDPFQITTGDFPVVRYIDNGSVSPKNTVSTYPLVF